MRKRWMPVAAGLSRVARLSESKPSAGPTWVDSSRQPLAAKLTLACGATPSAAFSSQPPRAWTKARLGGQACLVS
jgi:hypothetical protein